MEINYSFDQNSSKPFEPWWIKEERLQRKILEREAKEAEEKWFKNGGRPYTDFPPPQRSQRSDDPSNW